MRDKITLIFGVLWTSFTFSMLFFGVDKYVKFSNRSNTKEIIGIIDSTYYQYTGGGGGESYTIRVKYIVNDKIYHVYPNTAIYFEFENLQNKFIKVIYLKKNPNIAAINSFRERKLFIIGAFLFTILGIFIIVKSSGYKILRKRICSPPTNPSLSDSGNEDAEIR